MRGVILKKYEERADEVKSSLCVGLDPDVERIPPRFLTEKWPLFEFNRWVIAQTYRYVTAYKPNMAFYEAHGARGIQQLQLTIEYLRSEHPEILTICDAKRGDIGNTNRGYATAIFDLMGFDAVTLHPYLGGESLSPFLERADKACIILCRTSNLGAGEFQDLRSNGRALWEAVADRVSTDWDIHGNCMLVVGATYPQEMSKIRAIAPHIPFLVPGVGTQGGDVTDVIAGGLDARGKGLLLSSSRGILFSTDPGAAARDLRDEINAALNRHKEATHASS